MNNISELDFKIILCMIGETSVSELRRKIESYNYFKEKEKEELVKYIEEERYIELYKKLKGIFKK